MFSPAWEAEKAEVLRHFQHYRKIREVIINVEKSREYPPELTLRVNSELLPAIIKENYPAILEISSEIEKERLKWYYKRLLEKKHEPRNKETN